MTESQLRELEAICEMATPGPWHVKHERQQACDFYTVLDANGFWVADCGSDKTSAEAIATARTALPAALAEVRRLKAALREACDLGLSAENPKATGAECVAYYERLHALSKEAES